MRDCISGCVPGWWRKESRGGKGKSAKESRSANIQKVVEKPLPCERLVVFEDGSAYYGCVSPDGKPHGFGTSMSAAGEVYEGEWVNGLRHGTGRITSSLGQVFAGTYREGRRHGDGLAGPKPQGAPIFHEVWDNGVLIHRQETMVDKVVDVEEVRQRLEEVEDLQAQPDAKQTTVQKGNYEEAPDEPDPEASGSKEPPHHLLPGSVLDWTTHDVVLWLQSEGLEKFAKKFKKGKVTGEILINMDRAALDSIGINRFGHRSRVQDSLKQLRMEWPGMARNSSTGSGGSGERNNEVMESRPSSSPSFGNPVPQVESQLILPWSRFTGLAEQNRSFSMSLSSPTRTLEEGSGWTFGKRPRTLCQYLGAEVSATMLRGGLPKTATPSVASPTQNMSGFDLAAAGGELRMLPLPPNNNNNNNNNNNGNTNNNNDNNNDDNNNNNEDGLDEVCRTHRQWVELVQTLERVRHSNIVFFLGVTVAEDFAHEYYVISSPHSPIGCSLEQWLYGRPNGVPGHPGSARSVASICIGIAVGLQYLHSCGLVHRHLQPDCIHLEGRGKIKAQVADWMLAALEAPLVKPAPMERLEGMTPYLAPEVMRNPEVALKSSMDIYSFAVVIWEILSRCRPYTDLTPAQMVMAVGYAKEELPTPPNLGKPITNTQTRIWSAARHCLNPRPDWRLSATQVVERIGRLKKLPTYYEENLPNFFGCY